MNWLQIINLFYRIRTLLSLLACYSMNSDKYLAVFRKVIHPPYSFNISNGFDNSEIVLKKEVVLRILRQRRPSGMACRLS